MNLNKPLWKTLKLWLITSSLMTLCQAGPQKIHKWILPWDLEYKSSESQGQPHGRSLAGKYKDRPYLEEPIMMSCGETLETETLELSWAWIMEVIWVLGIPLLDNFSLILLTFLIGSIWVFFSRYWSWTQVAAKTEVCDSHSLKTHFFSLCWTPIGLYKCLASGPTEGMNSG